MCTPRVSFAAVLASLSSACLLSMSAAHARDNVPVYGMGGIKCSSFLQTRAKNDRADELAVYYWETGFLSARNTWSADPQLDLAEFTPDTVSAFLDRYCGSNPTSNVYQASQSLMIELSHSTK